MHELVLLFRCLLGFCNIYITNVSPNIMNYLTAKNERRRRRKARLLTAFITITMLAALAYAVGAFDAWLVAGTSSTIPVA